MRRPLRILAALVLACELATHPARADEAQASVLIEQGLDLRQAHRDAEALVLFEKAQSMSPSPRGQAQVALAQQALGRWVPAEKNLHAALAVAGDTWIDTRRPILERALSVIQGHLGDVELAGAKGAVFVDGERIEDPDALTHLRLEVGRRMLELRSPGLYPFSRVLDVLPGEVLRVEVEQHPLLDAPTPAAPAAVTASAAPVPMGPESHVQRNLGWVALGGAGLFVATGIGGLVLRSSAAGDFNADSSCTSVPSNVLSSQCRSWLDQGTTGQTLAIVGFVGGGLVAALGVALVVTAPTRSAKTVSFPCAPTKGGAWCRVEAVF